MTPMLLERYAKEIRGSLSCFDRVVITGTIPEIGYAGAMSHELWKRGFVPCTLSTPIPVDQVAVTGR